MSATASYETFQAALAEIGNDLGEGSLNVRGVADDPAVISTALFWRVTSHFRAFTMLLSPPLIGAAT